MKTFNFLETTDFLNPFFIDGRQIKRIHFFNKSGIIFSTRSGWFGSNNNFRGGFGKVAAYDDKIENKAREMVQKYGYKLRKNKRCLNFIKKFIQSQFTK